MNGIYIIALITTLIVLAWYGGITWRRSEPSDRTALMVAFFITLPLSPLVLYYIRLPLDNWLVVLSANSGVLSYLRPWYAPLTEEPAKLLPLLLPLVWRRIHSRNYILFAMALGLGFGIGEIWYLAYATTLVPAMANIPFYQFSGFLLERLMVCLIHGALTGMILWGFFGQKRISQGVIGILGALLGHFLLNLPILLTASDIGGFGKTTWQNITWIWLFIAYGLSLLWFTRSNPEKGRKPIALFGKALCPGCGVIYARPFFGVSRLNRRYERCPYCHQSHWITKADLR
jgi:hypothetical protein